jgi:hypothetical protein
VCDRVELHLSWARISLRTHVGVFSIMTDSEAGWAGPRVGKKAIILEDEKISLRSPRLVAAMKSKGVTIDELRPVKEEDIVRNVKLTEIAYRRKQAFEAQQRMVVDLVLTTREQLIKDETAQKARKDKAAATGAGAKEGGDDLSTMLANEQEHMQKILEASTRRIASEKAKMEAGDALEKQRMQEQQRADEQLARRKADQMREIQQRRSENLQKQLEREAKVRAEASGSVEVARMVEGERIERERQIEQSRLEREEKMREKSLQFVKEHGRKMKKILKRQAEKEERLANISVSTAAKIEASDIKRKQKIAEQQQLIMKENKLRNQENEKRRLERSHHDQKRMLEQEKEIKTHLEDVDRRLQEKQGEKQASLRRKRDAEEEAEAERLAKLKAIEQGRLMSEGNMVGKAEEKEQQILRALKRKDQKLQIQAEESRLAFEQKRRHVARMHRKYEYEKEKAKDKLLEKDHKVETVNEQKKRMKDERRRMAQQFFVQQRQLQEQAVIERRKAASATPTSGTTTAVDQRNAMKRLSDIGMKGVPDQPFWKKG